MHRSRGVLEPCIDEHADPKQFSGEFSSRQGKLLGDLAGLWFAWLIHAEIRAEIHTETA